MKIILLGLTAILFTSCRTASVDTVLIEGQSSIGSKAPAGWTPVRPKRIPLCVAYVLEGHTFDSSPAVIYPRLAGGKSIDEVVSASADEVKKSSDAFRLEKKDSYRSKKDFVFEIRHFLNGPRPNVFEAVGYLAHKSQIFMVVYSTPEQESFTKHMDGFYAALDNVAPYSSDLPALSGNCLVPN